MNEHVSLPAADDAATRSNSRKVFIKTYGCQMNVYDSTRMGDALASDGYVTTEDMGEADLILLNTCHIREKAADKVYSALGRLRDMKKARQAQGKELMIGVAGCVAQAEGEEILRRSPAVDVVIGPQTYHRLPDALKQARSGTRVVDTEYAVEDKFEHLPATSKAQIRSRGVTAFLTVQEGCDKFCTFCVVPYTRGSEVSRPVSQIIDEAKRLVMPACAKSRFSARTSMPGQARGRMAATGASATFSISSPIFRALPVCATRPATRATWTTS